jgi:hypothetical protein
VGDLNDDGSRDLAVAGTLSSSSFSSPSAVGILLGNGDGTFQAGQTYLTATSTSSVAAGDLNGDGHADLAVANSGSDTVNIMLGRGDGTLKAASIYPVGSNPQSVAVGNFNDLGTPGIADLAVANKGSNKVTILLGRGDGTFQVAYSYAVGANPISVVVGDFNADGHLDLAVLNNFSPNGTLSILLGNGDGTFQHARSYGVGSNSGTMMAVGDFNSDGHLDIVINTGIILYGKVDRNGTFTFQAAQPYGAGGSAVAVGDFNGDGKLDIVVSNPTSLSGPPTANTVGILLGNGDGTFQPAQYYDAGFDPTSVVVGDFNGDGQLDLAVTNYFTPNGTVSVLLGNGDGTFQAGQISLVDSDPDFAAAADFNNDGARDLAVVTATQFGGGGTLNTLLGNGNGTFQAAQSYQVGPDPVSVTLGDFNGDSFPDLAAVDAQLNTVTVLLNAGNGGGGQAAAPPSGPGLRPVVPRQLDREFVPPLLPASKALAQPLIALPLPDLRPNPVQRQSVAMETNLFGQPEVTPGPRPLLTARHAQDAVFEQWDEGGVDALAWNMS